MLSILIPTYNHVCLGLVREVVGQASQAGYDYEVIVGDDGSTNLRMVAENSKIDDIDGCRLIVTGKNIGIARMRNMLMNESKGDYMLFLDSDVMPASKDFLQKYVDATKSKTDVVVGGIMYRQDGSISPLRLKYGIEREQSTAAQRKLRGYSFISSAFMLSRKVAEAIRFDESFDRYGHEDTLFGVSLKLAGMQITHIDAPVFHDNTDTSEEFVEKTRVAIQSLIMHYDELRDYSRLAQIYEKTKKLHLTHVIGMVYKYFRRQMEKNLLSAKPSLRILDMYKLSYMCRINRL